MPVLLPKIRHHENAITTLRIQNFKSIKDVEMKPRRVNIVIGEPNVGKSNILEAMSLLGGMCFDGEKFMEGQIRCETIRNLFYDNGWSQEITGTGEEVGATRIRKRNEQAEVMFGDGEMRRSIDKSFSPMFAGLPGLALGATKREQLLTGKQDDTNRLVNFEDKNHLYELINSDGSTSLVHISEPQLSEDILHIRRDGLDVFYNMNRFVPER